MVLNITVQTIAAINLMIDRILYIIYHYMLYKAIKYPIVGFINGFSETFISGEGELYDLFLVLYLPCLIGISIATKTWEKTVSGLTLALCFLFLGLTHPDIANHNIFIFIPSAVIWIVFIKQIRRVYLHFKNSSNLN